MDLLKLLKQAVKHPLQIKSTFVIFVTLFIVLIIGLTMLAVISNLGFGLTRTGACDRPLSKRIHSSVGKTKEVSYTFNFSGNSKCFFETFVTWKNQNEAIAFWLYDPSGRVTIYEPTNKETHNLVYLGSPIAQGNWRLVLKTESNNINFNGEINFH